MLNQIFTALRIYDNINSQHHRKHYCTENSFKHIAPINKLLPFQYIRNHEAIFTQTIEIYNLSDDLIRTILAPEISADLNILGRSDGTDVIIYEGLTNIDPLDPGTYYLKISDGAGNTFFSEVFKAFDFEDDCYMKLVAKNSCDIGKIYHRDDMFNDILYLDLDLGKPIYKYQEEGEEGYDKTFTPTLQRTDKYYTIEFFAPEYICDFLSMIKFYDDVTLQTKDNGIMQIEDINVNIEWSDISDCYAKITVEFTINKVVKTGCCDNIEAFECIPTNVNDVVGIANEDGESYTTPDMVTIPLVEGDRVLYNDGTGLLIGTFIGGVIVAHAPSNVAGAIVYDANTGFYYYFETFVTSYSIINHFNQIPIITATTDFANVLIVGYAYPGFTVQVEVMCDDENWVEVGAPISAEDFNIEGKVVPFTGACYYRIRMESIFCTQYSNFLIPDA